MEATSVTPAAQPGAQAASRRSSWRAALQRTLGNYTVQTVLQAFLTIWAVMTFTFILIRQMPSNPVEIETERLIREEQLSYDEAYSKAAALFDFNPAQPFLAQCPDYMARLPRLAPGH